MGKERFANVSSILTWAGTDKMSLVDNVLVVPKDNLFWYFSQDEERYYNLIMLSERNLAENE